MLDPNYYTISNALNYQMFYGHFKEATNSQGTLGHRLCHAGIAVLELFPVIGAIIELAIVKILGKTKASCCKDLSENKIEELEEELNISEPTELPTIPGKYALAALAFVVIAPFVIYAIASRFLPADAFGDPLDAAEKIKVSLPGEEEVTKTLLKTFASNFSGSEKISPINIVYPSLTKLVNVTA